MREEDNLSLSLSLLLSFFLRSFFPVDRECDRERAALADAADDGNIAVVLVDDLFGDGQPQPHPAKEMIAYGFEVVEAIKDMINLIGRDAHARIDNGDLQLRILIGLPGYFDLAPVRAELDGIVEQSLEGFTQSVEIAARFG